MIDDVLLETEEKMDKTVQFLQQELSGLRTGKANPALVENISVDYYGTPTRLRDIANISTPEARLIVVNPFDPSSLGAIEKAIVAANIGITPLNDGESKSDLVAVGLWTHITVRLLKIPTLEEITKEVLGGEMIPRSILMAQFEGTNYLARCSETGTKRSI